MSRGRLRKACPWHCSFFQPYRLREPSTALASNTHTGIQLPLTHARGHSRGRESLVLPGLRAAALGLSRRHKAPGETHHTTSEEPGFAICSPPRKWRQRNEEFPPPKPTRDACGQTPRVRRPRIRTYYQAGSCPNFTTFRTSSREEPRGQLSLTYAGRCLRFSVQSPRSRQGRGRMATTHGSPTKFSPV